MSEIPPAEPILAGTMHVDPDVDCPGRTIENHSYDEAGNDVGDVHDCVLPPGHPGDHDDGQGYVWQRAPHE